MIRFSNELRDSGYQFPLHSDIFQESNEPVFDLNGMYPDRDCVIIALDKSGILKGVYCYVALRGKIIHQNIQSANNSPSLKTISLTGHFLS